MNSPRTDFAVAVSKLVQEFVTTVIMAYQCLVAQKGLGERTNIFQMPKNRIYRAIFQDGEYF